MRDLARQAGLLPGSVLWTMALFFGPWQTELRFSNNSRSVRCAITRVAEGRATERVGHEVRDRALCIGYASASSLGCPFM